MQTFYYMSRTLT